MVESNETIRHLNILHMLSSQITANKVGKYDEIVENEPGALVRKNLTFPDKNRFPFQGGLGLP